MRQWGKRRRWRPVDLVLQYANAGVYILGLRLHPRDGILWGENAAEGARLSEDRGGEGNALGNLGRAHLGKAIGRAGSCYLPRDPRQSEIQDKAIDYYEQRLVIAREIGDRRGEGNALGNLGIVYKNLRETDKAIEHHGQALVISREIGDRRGEGNALGSLGIAYSVLGETDKAIEHHEQALVISREIGDRRGEGRDLANLGLAYETLQRFAEARDAWTAALALFEAIGDPNAEQVRQWLAELET